MSLTLKKILGLVGKLDDSSGDDTARERFRSFLRENVGEVGQVRDFIEECLRNSGPQFNRALQDLVNFLGEFLGFQVKFGRYQGTTNEVGFDGLWQSATGFHLVVEVKTTETYAIKTATLMGYVDHLISYSTIPNWDSALGLYVVGRPDPEITQLQNAIIAEKRSEHLRIISVESLLSIAELMNQFDVAHEDILTILRPGGPTVDPIVDLMARLAAQKGIEESASVSATNQAVQAVTTSPDEKEREAKTAFWITPVRSTPDESAEDCVRNLVGSEMVFAVGENNPGRRRIKADDWICFYAAGKGIVAHATVASSPEKESHPKIVDSERYPWVFHLEKPTMYTDKPLALDAAKRNLLDAFKMRDPGTPWSWFVQITHEISEHDFRVLTGQEL